MITHKWGILGTGAIARKLAEALSGTDGAECYAVASRTLSKAESFANEYGFAKTYGSYRELAEDPDVEVIYIATPMANHYEDSILCISNGKNVLCEKSIALNAQQFEAMLESVRKYDVFFMEAMWMKCRPTYRKVREWIDSGRIGEVRFIKADFLNHIPYNAESRLYKSECGGGAMLDLGVYPITIAADILGGMPDEIISSAVIGKDGVDLNNTTLLRYGDAAASLDSGFQLQCRNNALISGTEGYITMGDWFHCSCEAYLYDNESVLLESAIILDEINGYEYEVREVHRCLENGEKESPLVPHYETLEVMRIMDECRKQWGMSYPQEIENHDT